MLQDLIQNPPLALLEQSLSSKNDILIEGLWNAPKALIASIAQKVTGKHILILTGGSQEELRLFHDFPFFTNRPVVDFPSWETLPSENIPPSPDIVGERYKVLKEISGSIEPHIILTGLQSCLQRLIAPSLFLKLNLSLSQGQQIAFDALIEDLLRMGYQRRPVAADKGEFAVRGGIIDVFSVASPDPFRLEFWGDELESIRIYDPIGQKSVRQVDAVELAPAQELELLRSHSELATLLDYLGPNTLIIFDDLLALEDRYASLINLGGKSSRAFASIEEFLDSTIPLQKILLTQGPIEQLSSVRYLDSKKTNFYSSQPSLHRIEIDLFNRAWQTTLWRHPFIPLSSYLCPEEPDPSSNELVEALARIPQDHHLQILCSTEQEETHFQQRLADAGIKTPPQTSYRMGYLSSGFALYDSKTALLPLTEITQRYKIRRQKLRSTYHTSPVETFDLSPGEFVVHVNNGIGRYHGLEKKPNHLGIVSEFFVIEYGEQAKLFVPINQAHLITKYIGASEEMPKLHTLGSGRWKKAKEQTEKAIVGYAAELLQLYASRAAKVGMSCAEDSPDFRAFEEEFPFTETEDQLAAVASCKQDMISSKVMDRLICGDVGYGKTEVAMRAAFKAVVDGNRQVAILVPTTVLATQHYENFVERMANFPVKVGLLSRFCSPKQIRDTVKGVAAGSIDIVIGTHRLISQDVSFKNLGLVIIDEEQRFGVKAKEHLKKLKVGVDCLTLSATPIPRTLYMSLVGARDMSVINTPPQDRLPIKTVITEPSDEVIKNALLRELARDGQAFVIHNRVESIYDLATRIKSLLPQVRLIVAHGQMDPDEIDAAFHQFKKGEVDLLVATTIVENGIDIPNANTILIDRADQFGLATLYQLRGRVGRWNRRAYAYFLVPNQRSLSEVTRKRLNALAESSGYGGGMRLAMRDLEIRGAGDLLGVEQSGHVASIGFNLYCKKLKRAVQALQGEIPNALTDTKIEFMIDARLPEDYVNEVSLRMEIYQRLGEAYSWEEIDLIWEEVQDRFGPPPEPAVWLYHYSRIRVFAGRNAIVLIKQDKLSLTIEKRKGDDLTTRKIITPKYKTPQQFEEVVIRELTQTA